MNETLHALPTVPLRGMTILPGMVIHIDVTREKSLRAVEEAMMKDEKLLLITQRSAAVQEPTLDDLYRIGCLCRIKQVVRIPRGNLRILAEGLERAELLDFETTDDILRAEASLFPSSGMDELDANTKEAMLDHLRELFRDYVRQSQKITGELALQITENRDILRMVDQICMHLPLPSERQQKLLDAVDPAERYDVLCLMLANEVEILHIRAQLQKDVKERIDKNQREYILREQLKLIREELGEDNLQSEIRKFREQTEALKASREVKEKLREEIRRLENIVGNPSESSVARGYIETLLGLPWDRMARDNRDLKKARLILEADHYGLEKVKERILEYLAVRQATKKADAPILCLVGPPGTGKTSISKSVARALNKTFVRVSLGGVRDEAEIRGHRRTYLCASPVRIA